MIGHLSGTLLRVRPDRVLLEVGGVGYEVSIPLGTYTVLAPVGSRASLFVHTHVREDALQLFGFSTEEERTVFLKLIAVSGIGPRMALNVLSGLPLTELIAAIVAQDTRRLTLIPGVGKKLAERIGLELKEKLADVVRTEDSRERTASGSVAEDAVAALVNLGYRRPQAEAAVSTVARQVEAGDLQGLLQAALRSLAR